MSVAPLDDNESPVEIHVSGPALAPAPTPVHNLGYVPARQFEDNNVDVTVVKITGTVTADLAGDETLHLDDRVRLVGDFRVVAVNHYVDKKGHLVREQKVAPCDTLQLAPWDASNPVDNGILRANP